MTKKVVLAFSGGLDTTYCVKYLKEVKKMEVHTALVDTGGFSAEELKKTEAHAYNLGASSHNNLYETENFYQNCIRYLIFGNILKNRTYPLSVSAERIFQATAIANYAKKIGADAIAHGSTGAGNDQVRFDMAFQILCPEMEIITPIRDQKLSREEEVNFLKEHGIEWNAEKAQYSINQGLWGTSVGGKETLTSNQYLPEEAFPTPLQKETPEEISIDFANGEPIALNGEKKNPIELIKELQTLAQPFAIGRDIHVGDTIIGIKGRVGFEAAAPLLLINAHYALEKHTLTHLQIQEKEPLAQKYATLLHEGKYLEPLMRNIEVFLTDTQKQVTGKVLIYLAPYRFHIIGVESEFDLMHEKFGSYGEMNQGWSGEDVRGFAKIAANQNKIYYQIQNG